MSQVRVRQVMSIIESQWSNAAIVVVSPGTHIHHKQGA
jgi:hypothetical protein